MNQQASTEHVAGMATISAAAEEIRRGGVEPSDHAELMARLDQLASVRRMAQIGAAIGHKSSTHHYALHHAHFPRTSCKPLSLVSSPLSWYSSAARRPMRSIASCAPL
jgi:hypothetical protein